MGGKAESRQGIDPLVLFAQEAELAELIDVFSDVAQATLELQATTWNSATALAPSQPINSAFHIATIAAILVCSLSLLICTEGLQDPQLQAPVFWRAHAHMLHAGECTGLFCRDGSVCHILFI